MANSPWENKEFARRTISHIDEKFLPGTELEVRFLETEMEIDKGAKIIDLGCGTGRHSIELGKRGYNLVGVDISEVLIDEGKRRARSTSVDVKFIKGDLRFLDKLFESKEVKFDGAICLCESGFGVLGGEEQDINFLKTIYDLLKPKGKFVLTTFNGIRKYRRYKEKDSVFDYLRGVVHWKTPPGKFREELTEETRVYTPTEVRMMFTLSGFSNIKIFGCAPGDFRRQKLNIDDIEMMVLGEK